MHADPIKGGSEGALDFLHQVIGIEDGIAGGFGYALPAQGHEVGQSADHHQEVAGEAPDLLSAGAIHGDRLGQVGGQEVLATHGACARTAAAVGGGKGLVQIQVDAVKAHIAGAYHAHDGVEVGSVVIAQTAGFVDQTGDLQNVLIEDANGIGIGEHQSGGVFAQHLPEGLQIHTAVGGGGNVHHLIAAHGGSGRVGAVGGVGDDDLGAAAVAPRLVVLLDEQDAGELAVGAGGRLEGHIRHTGDLTQILLGGLQHVPAAFGGMLGAEGMDAGKAGQGGHLFINPGIVLHGAGAQGIEAAVNAMDLPAQLAVVPGDVGFAHLRQGRRLGPGKSLRQFHGLHITGGKHGAAATGHAFLKNQFHWASTSFTMAMV